MGDLADVCGELEQVLHNISDRCESFSGCVDQIKERMDDAAQALKAKLAAVADDLRSSEKTLCQQHSGGGYVCLLMGTDHGLTMHWVKSKEIMADCHVIPGWTVVSVEEVVEVIADLAAKVDTGKPADAVRWIKAYGCQPFI